MEKMREAQAARLLQGFSVPFARQFIAKNEEQAIAFARRLGFPVVMKVSSPDIVHKTEAMGVMVDLKTEREVVGAFGKIKKNAKKFKKNARIEGVIIQQQLKGKELIVGAKQDPSFGPFLMFGLGGIFVEILKDVSFRLVPLERRDAREMIGEIKGLPLLEGVRGEKPINFRALEDFLLKVSKLVEKNPRIQELDLNPVFVNSREARAADVRILI